MARIRMEAGQNVYSTEEILGSMAPVKDFAKFFLDHKIDLQMIKSSFLDDYTNTEFTPDGKKGFKMALDLFYKFFENAQDEMDRYVLENQKEK